ncbi:MAG: DUF2240 family protein [Thermoplasmata archaeon]|nr:DUF2240 family protein [Thermoplasmata archaeon]
MEPIEEIKVMVAKYVLVEQRTFTMEEMAFFFSLKQRWCTMDKSKAVVARAKEIGLLKEEDGKLVPAFDVDTVPLPPVFTPSNNLFKSLVDLKPLKGEGEEEGGGTTGEKGGGEEKVTGGEEGKGKKGKSGGVAEEGEDKEEETLMKIVSRIKGETGSDLKTVMREVNREQKKTGLSIEVAAILVAIHHKADIEGLVEETKTILSKPT